VFGPAAEKKGPAAGKKGRHGMATDVRRRKPLAMATLIADLTREHSDASAPHRAEFANVCGGSTAAGTDCASPLRGGAKPR
jgi:hypothetical protein